MPTSDLGTYARHEIVYPKGRYHAPIYAEMPENLRMGRRPRRRLAFRRNCLVCGPSVAPRQVLLRLTLGARHDVRGPRRLSGAHGAGECEGNHSGNTTTVFLETAVSERLAWGVRDGPEFLHYRFARSFRYGGSQPYVSVRRHAGGE